MSGSDRSPQGVVTCRAVVCWGPDEPWTVEDITVDPPSPSEVRIKLLYASVCHTDIVRSKGFPVPLFPRVLGHEGVGVVESIGSEATEFKVGDVVIPTFVGECRKCDNCKLGNTNLCLVHPLLLTGLMPDGTSRMSVHGQPLYHLFSCSTWSEYTVVAACYLVRVDPDLEIRHASFLSCGFTTGYGAAWRAAGVKSGSSVAVIGLGGVGLGAIQGSSSLGAAPIIGVDVNDSKRGKGEAFGMTHFINPNQSDKSLPELIRDLTGGMGVDYCFECVGGSALINHALESTKMGFGTVVAFGAGSGKSLEINFPSLVTGRTLKGTVFGGIKPRSDLPELFTKCKLKEIQLDQLASHEIGLDEVPKANQLLKQDDCVKILIKMC
ncbi:hypothetical protein MLD38_040045 [Melastoma candidum]|uniref:Uncharacterized protein n=1 Tax=Melastoma candidum TaxID=119954 RepID=A0ACB9L5L3_9MYRT|nr:hypothetical protein MLD38_040045 [Melastoma candidum]